MKVIVQGKDRSKPEPPWWVGMQVRCTCGCVFELEVTDKVDSSGIWASTYCPNPHCKLELKFHKPVPRSKWEETPVESLNQRLNRKLKELEHLSRGVEYWSIFHP